MWKAFLLFRCKDFNAIEIVVGVGVVCVWRRISQLRLWLFHFMHDYRAITRTTGAAKTVIRTVTAVAGWIRTVMPIVLATNFISISRITAISI